MFMQYYQSPCSPQGGYGMYIYGKVYCKVTLSLRKNNSRFEILQIQLSRL